MSDKKIRRKYLVNHRYQLSQAGVVLLSHLLVALLMAALLSWFYLFMLDGAIACNHNRQLPWYIVGLTAVIVLSTTWWTIRRSHRVAGSIFKIDKTLRLATSGEFPSQPFSFRRKDHFPELADTINRCLQGLQNCHEARNSILTVLLAVQARLENGELSSDQAAEAIRTVIAEFELEDAS